MTASCGIDARDTRKNRHQSSFAVCHPERSEEPCQPPNDSEELNFRRSHARQTALSVWCDLRHIERSFTVSAVQDDKQPKVIELCQQNFFAIYFSSPASTTPRLFPRATICGKASRQGRIWSSFSLPRVAAVVRPQKRGFQSSKQMRVSGRISCRSRSMSIIGTISDGLIALRQKRGRRDSELTRLPGIRPRSTRRNLSWTDANGAEEKFPPLPRIGPVF
jgi:hypothetical protein